MREDGNMGRRKQQKMAARFRRPYNNAERMADIWWQNVMLPQMRVVASQLGLTVEVNA